MPMTIQNAIFLNYLLNQYFEFFFSVINVFKYFLFYKTKNPPFGAGFSIFFKEKSTRPIINNSAGGANNT